MKVLLYAVFKDRKANRPSTSSRSLRRPSIEPRVTKCHVERVEAWSEGVNSLRARSLKAEQCSINPINGIRANDFDLSRQDPQPVNPSGATDSWIPCFTVLRAKLRVYIGIVCGRRRMYVAAFTPGVN